MSSIVRCVEWSIVPHRADRAIHMVLEGEYIPAMVPRTLFQLLYVQTFENVGVLELSIGGSDGGL